MDHRRLFLSLEVALASSALHFSARSAMVYLSGLVFEYDLHGSFLNGLDAVIGFGFGFADPVITTPRPANHSSCLKLQR